MDALISSGMVGAKEVEASTPGGKVVKLGLLLEDGPLRDEKEAMVKSKGGKWALLGGRHAARRSCVLFSVSQEK